MPEEKINCRFCQHPITPLKKGSARIIMCKHCKSEEWIEKDGSHYSWSFKVGQYEIGYYFESKTFKVSQLNKNGNWEKWLLDIPLKDEPTHMTPENMTEERVKSIIVFS